METPEPIAVVGMAGRFPASPDLDTFRANVFDGLDCLTELSDEELLDRDVDPGRMADPRYVRRRPSLERPEWFDAAAFGMTPREAQLRDPQYRIMLEVAAEALSHAGYDSLRYPGRIGMFAGANINSYRDEIRKRPDIADAVGYLAVEVGNASDYLSTFISYKLDLRGPSMTLLSACSTSLVALHQACLALRAGDCSMALAGGVDLEFPIDVGYLPTPGGILAEDGVPRPFGRQATGTNFGNGAGAVLLKPLARAREDGDTIHAVVLSSCVNNDGRRKVGFTAPSVSGQSDCIQQALRSGDVDPRTISYVEAHGTATPVGDPIELTALADAYRAVAGAELPPGYCAIGSVKSNIGHLGQAAGVAGVIKTVLALSHRFIPPSINVAEDDLNPAVDWSTSPFRVETKGREWPAGPGARRAAVSSFGIGGTNAHLVLEEYEEEPRVAPAPDEGDAAEPRLEPVCWSAATNAAADAYRESLATHFETLPADRFGDTAHTLRTGRTARAVRGAVLARSCAEAAAALRRPHEVVSADGVLRRVALAFPGQGSQRPGMLALGQESALFRRGCDAAFDVLDDLLAVDLRRLVAEGSPEELAETAVAQPLLYVAEYTLAHCLMQWGVAPTTVLGHSLGELVAGAVAGVFGFEDGLRAVAARARLMQEMPRGAMLSVRAGVDEVLPRLPGTLSLAAVNGERQVVVSGDPEAVAEMARACAESGWAARVLSTSHAFHSPAMSEAAEQFEAELGTLTLHEPDIEIISAATGSVLSAEDATSPRFWAGQLLTPVRFDRAAATLFEDGSRAVVEVGPGITLAGLLRGRPDARAVAARVLPTLGDGEEPARDVLAGTLTRLWVDGVPVERWVDDRGYRRVPAPGYPFERRRFWIDPLPVPQDEVPDAPVAPVAPVTPVTPVATPVAPEVVAPAPEVALERAWTLRELTWRREPGPDGPDPAAPRAPHRTALVLPPGSPGSPGGNGARPTEIMIRTALQQAGFRVVPLPPDVDVTSTTALAAVLDDLAGRGTAVDAVVHTALSYLPAELSAATLADQLATGFAPLTALGRAVIAHQRRRRSPVQLVVLGRGLTAVTGGEHPHPVAAMAPPLLATIGQEAEDVRPVCIDLGSAAGSGPALPALVDELASLSAPLVALRGDQRWLPGLEVVRPRPGATRLRPRGTYLITGGLGGLGLRMAQALTETGLRPRLGLLGRTAPAEGVAGQLARLEADGAEIEVLTADVTDPGALRSALERLERRFGPVSGVIHAAGVPGGGLLERRADADLAAVLAPKTHGLLALEEVLAGRTPDFLALFSSQAALGGFYGSADYAAANAFMDAWARSRVGGDTLTVSLQWAAWSEVGMAAQSPAIDLVLPPADLPATAAVALSRVHRPGGSWELDEHVFAGVSVLPGTAIMELVVLAAQRAGVTTDGVVEVRDALLLTPVFGGAEPDAVEVQVVLEPEPGGRRFLVRSRPLPAGGAPGEHWTDNVSGLLVTGAPRDTTRPVEPLEALRARLAGLRGPAPETAGWMTFGPRWGLVREVHGSGEERLARLALAEEFRADLAEHPLHPAILDVATTVLSDPEPGRQYAPFRYRRMTVLAPLPAEVDVHARFGPATLGGPRSVDVDLRHPETGDLLVAVEGFTMREVAGPLTAPTPAAPPAANPAATPAEPDPAWLSPQDGVDAFLEVLAGRCPPVVHVAPARAPLTLPGIPLLDAVLAPTVLTPTVLTPTVSAAPVMPVAVQPAPAPPAGPTTETAPSPPPATPAPGPGTDTVEDTVEDTVRALWAEVLGQMEMAPDQDFFDLGGTSLSAVQVTRRIQEVFGVRLSAGALFELNTLRLIAEEIRLRTA